MHEFSLAKGLVDQLLELAQQHGANKIVTVRVNVGKMSGIVVDSFSFGFEVLAGENPFLEDAVLEITEIHPAWKCLDCGRAVMSADFAAKCGNCGSSRLALEQGEELILTQVEME